MLIGYARVSSAGQSIELQRQALEKAGVERIYQDVCSGARAERPGLANCLKALRPEDTLVVWKLDRLGRSLKDLVSLVEDLSAARVGLRVLTGRGACIDTTSPEGQLVFGIFSALAEFERELIRERTRAGLTAARARGRLGGRRFKLTPTELLGAAEQLRKRSTQPRRLARELGISPQTLYRLLKPNGEMRESGRRLLKQAERETRSDHDPGDADVGSARPVHGPR